MKSVRIVFAEGENEIIREAVSRATFEGFEAVLCNGLEEACEKVTSGEAEGMIAGIDYTSREVILAARDKIGVVSKTFSASFVFSRHGKAEFVIGDAAACKDPTEEQLYDITLQTYETAKAVLDEEPKVALLSWSTKGSGGEDPVIQKLIAVRDRVRTARPEIQIDGELQLDAAVNPRVAEKKAPGSPVAGRANVLIVPELNTGNILYKAMEQFGGFTAAGPILQGFKRPCSDLSRGSTVEDVLSVIEVLMSLAGDGAGSRGGLNG